MDLSVREAAQLLAVSEDAVYAWIREGSLPAQRIGQEHRVNRVELQEWAAAHGRRLSAELFAAAGSETRFSLVRALERGGIHRDIAGARREDLLLEVTRLQGIPAGVDRDTLYHLLLAREALASTCVGRGIALPHPRDPLVLRLREPHVLLCFPKHAVDFGALDGEPVRALFLLLSPSVRVHLRLLAQLAFALHDHGLHDALHRREGSSVILERFRTIESGAVP